MAGDSISTTRISPSRREDGEARLRSAQLIAERIGRLPAGTPFIMTGDFNSPAGGEPYKVFASLLRDTRETAAKRSGPEATFSAFRGSTTGPRVDWILYRGDFKVLEAETVTRNDHGRYPSDHYPVMVVLEWER